MRGVQLSEYEVPAGTASLRRFVQCPAGCGTDYDGDELSDIHRSVTVISRRGMAAIPGESLDATCTCERSNPRLAKLLRSLVEDVADHATLGAAL
ncbi:hypothetical protein LPV64_00915, partial [Ralstonia pseudosolanacearum]|nr:hypothetical protein [Ralstonia pseudosolanacearum]